MDYKIIHYPRSGNWIVKEDVESYGGKFLTVNKLSGNVSANANDFNGATVFKSREDCINAIEALLVGPLSKEEIYRAKESIEIRYKEDIMDGREPLDPRKGDAYRIVNRMNETVYVAVWGGTDWIKFDADNVPNCIV